MLPHFRPWLDVWVEAAYGRDGFWWNARPEEHFRTASGATAGLADLVLGVLGAHPEIGAVVELGAGGGQLLSRLSCARPDLDLAGIDIRAPEPGLPIGIGWGRDLWDVRMGTWTTGAAGDLLRAQRHQTLILCVEYLDDLPCPIATRTSAGLYIVEVDQDGAERLGAPLSPEEDSWAARWWPVGRRVEVGLTRDHAWTSLLAALQPSGGLGLLIDYGHRRDTRPDGGSLMAYHRGRQVEPHPSAALNLTVAVATDSLVEAGRRAGATTVLNASQRQLMSTWNPAEPADPLSALVARSEHAALSNPAVWGSQWWLLQSVAPSGAPDATSGGLRPETGPTAGGGHLRGPPSRVVD